MPFSVFKDVININNSQKAIMIKRILDIKNSNQNSNSAWTSDINGEQFLLRNKFFRKLYKEIGTKVKEYASTLNINIEMIDFYMQRSWATVCDKDEYLNPHKHWQSNISFAYYLKNLKILAILFLVLMKTQTKLQINYFPMIKYKRVYLVI